MLSKLHGNFKFWFYLIIKFYQNCKSVTLYIILLAVYSIEVDGEFGRVKVTTKIDPHTDVGQPHYFNGAIKQQ